MEQEKHLLLLCHPATQDGRTGKSTALGNRLLHPQRGPEPKALQALSRAPGEHWHSHQAPSVHWPPEATGDSTVKTPLSREKQRLEQ